jgi:hypothetical protein
VLPDIGINGSYYLPEGDTPTCKADEDRGPLIGFKLCWQCLVFFWQGEVDVGIFQGKKCRSLLSKQTKLKSALTD